MQFRTEIVLDNKNAQPINYSTKVLMLGSCFAENIGNKLHTLKLPVLINPFGILYNPASIALSLHRLMTQKPFEQHELYYHRQLYLSFAHHTQFSHPEPLACLNQINESFEKAASFLQTSQFLILTFGTSYYYERADTKAIVANCHQLPASFFVHKLMSIDQIMQTWTPLLSSLQAQFPNLQIVFSLSPIRHWKDGAIHNQLSKAILTVAIHQLIAQFPEQCSYFPAYELLMDDLRDYRFYEQDMLHPNNWAIEYIWGKFQQHYMYEPQTKQLQQSISDLTKAAQHRPRHTQTAIYQLFAQKMLDQITNLNHQYPNLDFSAEKEIFAPKV